MRPGTPTFLPTRSCADFDVRLRPRQHARLRRIGQNVGCRDGDLVETALKRLNEYSRRRRANLDIAGHDAGDDDRAVGGEDEFGIDAALGEEALILGDEGRRIGRDRRIHDAHLGLRMCRAREQHQQRGRHYRG